jgi:intein/homing endonuclease
MTQILNVKLGGIFNKTKHILILGGSGSGKTSALLLWCYLFKQNGETILWRDDSSTEWLSLVDQFPWRVFIPQNCAFSYKHENVEYITYDPWDLKTLFKEVKRGQAHAIEFDPFTMDISVFVDFWSRFFFDLYKWKGPDIRSKVAFFTDELNDLAAGARRGFVPRQLQLASRIYLCLPPDQLVYGDASVKPVGSIREGERVLTHTGLFQIVTGVSRHPFRGDLVSLQSFYNYPLLLTPNHPLLVKRHTHYGHRLWQPLWMDEPQETTYLKTQIGFINSADVRKGDWIWLPKIDNRGKGQKTQVDIHYWVKDKISGYSVNENYLFYSGQGKKRIPRHVEIDYDFGKLLGYYIAEGCPMDDHHNVNFTFNCKEKDLIDDTVRLMAQCFGLTDYGLSESKETETTHVIFCSKIIATFLSEFCGHGAVNKHLPPLHLSFPLDALRGLLHGLFKGDGSSVNKSTTYSTVSPGLVHQIRELMLRFKWLSGVYRGPPSAFSNNPRYLCYVPKLFSLDFKDKIDFGFGEAAQRGPFQSIGSKARDLNYGEGFWLRVKRVGRVPYIGEVVNLEVANDATFVANGIAVHNSQKKYRKELIRLVASSHGYGDLHKPVREGFNFYIFKRMDPGSVPEQFKRYDKVIERLDLNEMFIVDENKSFNKMEIEEFVKPKRVAVRWTGQVTPISVKKADELAQWKSRLVTLVEVMHNVYNVPYKTIAPALGYSEQSGLNNLMKKYTTKDVTSHIETLSEQLKQLEKGQTS